MEGEQSAWLLIAEKRFTLTLSDAKVSSMEKECIRQELTQFVQEHRMVAYFDVLKESGVWLPIDEKKLKEMRLSNDTRLKELEAAEEDAKTNAGKTEVRDAVVAKAKFFAEIGDKQNALDFFEEAIALSVGNSFKIDCLFDMLRMALFFNDIELLTSLIKRSKDVVEAAGDWEKRNRLKVYEGLYCLLIRDFDSASTLLLDSVATFTCTELFPFSRLVYYTVVSCVLCKDRVTLKEKVLGSPDVLSVLSELDPLESFLSSLHSCDYASFLRALLDVVDRISQDRYLTAHQGFYLREARIVAYKQFLQSYRSVTLSSMSESFGVSEEFLDKDLSRFISTQRISCKIDKVAGIVETNRSDAKNAQYQRIIKEGDVLLNRLQKLARVIT